MKEQSTRVFGGPILRAVLDHQLALNGPIKYFYLYKSQIERGSIFQYQKSLTTTYAFKRHITLIMVNTVDIQIRNIQFRTFWLVSTVLYIIFFFYYIKQSRLVFKRNRTNRTFEIRTIYNRTIDRLVFSILPNSDVRFWAFHCSLFKFLTTNSNIFKFFDWHSYPGLYLD